MTDGSLAPWLVDMLDNKPETIIKVNVSKACLSSIQSKALLIS